MSNKRPYLHPEPDVYWEGEGDQAYLVHDDGSEPVISSPNDPGASGEDWHNPDLDDFR